MNKITIADAIYRLKPNSEFSYENDDYSTIKWEVLEGQAPTQSEINTTIELLETEKAQKEIEKVANKALAEAKLVALGLTTEDLQALGLI